MEIGRTLEDFFKRRHQLEEELIRSGRKLTDWYEERRGSFATMREFAMLEGLLQERRGLLEQLMKLDDDMLSQLISERSKREQDDKN
jgi:hypothetical protein